MLKSKTLPPKKVKAKPQPAVMVEAVATKPATPDWDHWLPILKTNDPQLLSVLCCLACDVEPNELSFAELYLPMIANAFPWKVVEHNAIEAHREGTLDIFLGQKVRERALPVRKPTGNPTIRRLMPDGTIERVVLQDKSDAPKDLPLDAPMVVGDEYKGRPLIFFPWFAQWAKAHDGYSVPAEVTEFCTPKPTAIELARQSKSEETAERRTDLKVMFNDRKKRNPRKSNHAIAVGMRNELKDTGRGSSISSILRAAGHKK